ncbi:MAG: hypothetical protein ACSHX8_06120 [Opitutaceae bacterium]
MRWLFRIALTLAFLGLIALAILPYLSGIQQELSTLHTAWKNARSGEPKISSDETAVTDEIATEPRRAVLIPTSEIDVADGTDPFIAEARHRAQQDPEEAMNWLQDQANNPDRLRGMLEVVALWAAKDSEEALLWLESNSQGIARLETLNSGVEIWAQQDPLAAAAWINGMANDGSKVIAAKTLASNWAKTNPDEALQWLNDLPLGPLRNEAAVALVESWTTSDPEKATIWALSEAEFNNNAELLNLSIQNYAQHSPDDAEAFMRELTDAYEAPQAIDTYVHARATNDPAEAMNWHANLDPQDPLKSNESSRIIMAEWSRTDSVAASSWLRNQSPSVERDTAIIGFNETMMSFEPEAATAWVNLISNPEVRTSKLTASIQTWASTQPVEALYWVKTAELEPDLRTALANEIGAD